MGRTHVTLDPESGVCPTRPLTSQSSHKKLTMAGRALSWSEENRLISGALQGGTAFLALKKGHAVVYNMYTLYSSSRWADTIKMNLRGTG
jgi:hypothetical protein